MKANELRLGNWIMDRGYKEWQIDHWETRNKIASNNTTTMCNGIMHETHPLTEYVDYLKPISLTEEWLLKFGFRPDKGKKWYGLDGFYMRKIDDKFETEVGECLYKTIDYVHQLQNLYFALNDEELTMK